MGGQPFLIQDTRLSSFSTRTTSLYLPDEVAGIESALEQERRVALVVRGDQPTVAAHRRQLHGEPVDDADGPLVVGGHHVQLHHRVVRVAVVLGPFGGRIPRVRRRTAVDAGVGQAAARQRNPRRHRLVVRPLYALSQSFR